MDFVVRTALSKNTNGVQQPLQAQTYQAGFQGILYSMLLIMLIITQELLTGRGRFMAWGLSYHYPRYEDQHVDSKMRGII